jgi:dTDP-4-dehydrorhamnose 3,5-epimerase
MHFIETGLPGAYVVELSPIEDERGFFARTFDAKLFEEHGMNPVVAQANLSYNRRKGTLRGMHMQVEPAPESKFVRCLRGGIHDVIVDMRPDSPAYTRHFGVELTADNRRALFVPENFAHGFQTLEDETDVFYEVSQFYTPGTERGYRHDDPAFGIEWPLPVSTISEKDAGWAAFQREPEGASR